MDKGPCPPHQVSHVDSNKIEKAFWLVSEMGFGDGLVWTALSLSVQKQEKDVRPNSLMSWCLSYSFLLANTWLVKREELKCDSYLDDLSVNLLACVLF